MPLRKCVVAQQKLQTGQQANRSRPDVRRMPLLVPGGFSRHSCAQRFQNAPEEEGERKLQGSTTGLKLSSLAVREILASARL